MKKTLPVILILGGLISVGYYFLLKSKPKVTEKQLDVLNDTKEVKESEKELVEKPATIEQELQITCRGNCKDIKPISNNENIAPVEYIVTNSRGVTTIVNTETKEVKPYTSVNSSNTPRTSGAIRSGVVYSSGRRG